MHNGHLLCCVDELPQSDFRPTSSETLFFVVVFFPSPAEDPALKHEIRDTLHPRRSRFRPSFVILSSVTMLESPETVALSQQPFFSFYSFGFFFFFTPPHPTLPTRHKRNKTNDGRSVLTLPLAILTHALRSQHSGGETRASHDSLSNPLAPHRHSSLPSPFLRCRETCDTVPLA